MRTPKPMPAGAQESLKMLMRKTKTKADYQRVMAVWLRASLKLSASQIATALGWSTSSVHRIHSKYFQQRGSALLGVGRGGRRRQNAYAFIRICLWNKKSQCYLPFFRKPKVGAFW